MIKIKIFLMALAAFPQVSFSKEPSPCFDMDPIACETFSLTNVERLKENLPTLIYSQGCFAMAQEQSTDMAERDYFAHDRPAFPDRSAESFHERVVRFDIRASVGENIAMARSPAQAMALWMDSPGHRQNILSPRFRSLGVGFKDGLYTQCFSN